MHIDQVVMCAIAILLKEYYGEVYINDVVNDINMTISDMVVDHNHVISVVDRVRGLEYNDFDQSIHAI